MSNEAMAIWSVSGLTFVLLLLRHGLMLIGRRGRTPRGVYLTRLNRDDRPPDPDPQPDREEVSVIVKRGSYLATMLVVLACAAYREARAQQTIFNVPSSDVLPKAKIYGELDATWKPNDNAKNVVQSFSSFVPRLVVGAGGDVEVGLNVTGNIQPGPDATTLVPVVKWRVYNGKDNGWSVVVGDHLFIPVRNRAYHAGDYVYAQVSKSFGGRTRLTAGGYDFSPNVVAANAHRAGGQFGFEHAVNARLTVQADWFTGHHANGYFTPGFYFKPHPKVTLYGGYSIGNADVSKGNHFFYAALGINFN